MTKRALAALAACLAIVVVGAGCGGGSGSTTGSSTSGEETSAESGSAPTKATFIKEADAICKESHAELTEEVESYAEEHGISIEKEPSKPQQEEIYEAVVLPNLAKQGEEIGALTPPAGDEDAVGEIVDALDSGVEEAEADPRLLVEGKDPFSDASSKARAYGMKVCGSEE
jgi:hypothetical protein